MQDRVGKKDGWMDGCKSLLNATISGVENVTIKRFPCTSVCLQAAQTSALSDRQVEQRRILELENTVKTVSNDCFTLIHQLGAHQHFDRSVLTSLLSRPRPRTVGARAAGPALSGAPVEGVQRRGEGGAERSLCRSHPDRRGGGPEEGGIQRLEVCLHLIFIPLPGAW